MRNLFYGLLACSVCAPLGAQPAAPLTPQSTVLSEKAARPLFRQCSRAAPQRVTGYWMPTPADAINLEAHLPGFIATQKLPRSVRKSGLKDALHQLAGFTRGDQKFIYVNAFSRRETEMMRLADQQNPLPHRKPFDWRREPLVVCDGGPNFWGVEYDVQARTFSNLQFNGPPEIER